MGHDGRVSEPHRPIDGLLDRLVYAPLGLVTDARTVVPQLAERGRLQVANAKMMGRFAVQMGSSEAAKRVGGLEGHLRSALVGFGFLPPEVDVDGASGTPTAESLEETPAGPSPAAVVHTARSKTTSKATAGTSTSRTSASAPAAVSCPTDRSRGYSCSRGSVRACFTHVVNSFGSSSPSRTS